MKHTCDRYALCQIRKSGKSYRAMERAYREGKVRAIGVSNFYPDRFIDLQEHVEAQKYMEKYGCHIMSWGPFAEGLNDFFHNEVLTEIGKAHGKTLAQTALS